MHPDADDYGAMTEALFANDLARRCAMVPGVVPDPVRLVDLAGRPWRSDIRIRSIASTWRWRTPGRPIRRGRREANAARASPGGDREPMAALIAAVLAIAHQGLGHPDEAARQLAAIDRLDWDAVDDGAIPRIGGGAPIS